MNQWQRVDDISQACLELFENSAKKALAEQGRFRLLISGGSTPIPFFKLLAQQVPRLSVLLRNSEIYWVDERLVPPEDPRSNFGQFQKMAGPFFFETGVQIHRIHGELGAEAAKALYDEELAKIQPFHFDLCLLGMGVDGHTASIFPGDSVPLQSEAFSEIAANKRPVARLTITLKTLRAAENIVVVVSGEDKADLLFEIWQDSASAHDLPISQVCRHLHQVLFLADAKALKKIPAYALKKESLKSRIKLILSDVDGTLVPHTKEITPATFQAVERLHSAGILFSVISARPPWALAELRQQLNIDIPCISSNGGAFVNPDLKPFHQKFIQEDLTGKVLHHIEENHLDAWAFGEENWFVKKRNTPHVDHEITVVQREPQVIRNWPEVDLSRILRIVAVTDDTALMQDYESKLETKMAGRLSISRSQDYFLDMTAREANKGQALDDLCAHLGLSTREAMCFGDMPNDTLMFETGAFSVAMGNAAPEVKAKANYVTLSNEEDGFAVAVQKLLFSEE